MKGILSKIIAGFFYTTVTTSAVYATIAGGADKIINDVSPNVNIGIEVFDLNSGATLFKRNSEQFFIPASNMKLFSDAAALMVLGPDYHFKNYLSLSTAKVQQGVLKGSLYLYLSGDPSFSRERLAALLKELKAWQISRIEGNVYIASTHADVSPYAPGWVTKDLAYSYGAPLAPLMIDANRLTVTVNPASRAGETAIVELDENCGHFTINNQVSTKAPGSHCGVDFAMDSENNLTVRGCVEVGQWAVQQKMAIKNPLNYAKALIKYQLNQSNINLDGQVLLGALPSDAMLIATDSSKTIAQLMADTLKPSDNLYADSLFLHAAHRLHGSPVNWKEAQDIIKPFIQQQTGIDLSKASLTDGSGLSRNDLLSPQQTVQLLRFLFERFPLSYEYIAALPVSGRDGTLQRRFKKPNQQDLVRAKTGTMTGVVSLSGYLYTNNAHTLAFAMFINNKPGTKASVSGRYRYLIDALCDYFLRQKPSNHVWSAVFSSAKRIQYQLSPTQAEQQRGRQAKWRRLEIKIKQALRGQSVTVVYRGDELVLQDSQANVNAVLGALQEVRKHYPFAASLTSKAMPTFFTKPLVVWTEAQNLPTNIQRIWTIRETN